MHSLSGHISANASGDLIASLRVVEDVGSGGLPRFQHSVQRRLQRMVLGRAYGKALLEFAIFIGAACDADPRRHRYEDAVWSPNPATARAFRAAFAGHPGITEQGITVNHAGGEFIVHFSRMPLLSALAEFLVTILGYEEFDAILAPVCRQDVQPGVEGEVANAIGRAVSAWLAPRLDSAHAQQRVRLVSEKLAEAERHDVNASILDAWQDWSVDPDIAPFGFVTFRSVYRGFLQYVAAAAEARAQVAIDAASRIGTERDLGEVEPDNLAVLETLDQDTALLAALEQPPLDEVKFLTGREREMLAILAEAGIHLSTLEVSFLRDRVWGDLQLKITEARRRRRPWSAEPDQSYRDTVDAFAGLRDKVEQIALATLGVLLEERSEQALVMMIGLVPDLDLSGAARSLPEGVVAFPGGNVVDLLMRRLQTDANGLGAQAADLVSNAAKALRKTSRRGFDPKSRAPETLDAFESAVDVLIGLRRFADRGLRLLQKQNDLESGFLADQPVFASQFTRIYGEAQ